VCSGGRCRACGSPGQPCCASETCLSGNTCAGGTCAACGARDGICCTDPLQFPYPCENPNSCVAGRCVACGYANERCCAGSSCGTGYTCDARTNVCVRRLMP